MISATQCARAATLAGLLTALPAAQAFAITPAGNTPPASTITISAYDQNSRHNQIFSHAAGTISQLGSTATANIGATPYVYASTSSTYGFAAATLKYYFSVSGPGSDLVPLHASYLGRVTGSDGTQNALGGWQLSISNSSSSTGSYYAPSYPMNYEESGVLDFTAAAGDVTKVSLSVNTFVNDTSTFSASAYLDPIFTIDPTFAAAHPGYSLSFSDGVGNGPSGVPEPASWALMLIGMGSAGASLRLRRRTAWRPAR